MLIGLGDLGSVVLELLAREEGLGQIVSRDDKVTR
jgi:tRNA A37 threonylcarbamoyladenosine dehydratase